MSVLSEERYSGLSFPFPFVMNEIREFVYLIEIKVCVDLLEYYTNRTNRTKTWTNILKDICFGRLFKKHISSAER